MDQRRSGSAFRAGLLTTHELSSIGRRTQRFLLLEFLAPMSNEVTPGSEAARIIADEERLHAQVQARVALGDEEVTERVDADDYDRELLSLRDAVAEAKPEDLAPLVEQMTRLAAIRSRLGRSRALPVDAASPYFAHMALRDGERRR